MAQQQCGVTFKLDGVFLPLAPGEELESVIKLYGFDTVAFHSFSQASAG